MKNILLILLFIIPLLSSGQNLISNGGFETYTTPYCSYSAPYPPGSYEIADTWFNAGSGGNSSSDAICNSVSSSLFTAGTNSGTGCIGFSSGANNMSRFSEAVKSNLSSTIVAGSTITITIASARNIGPFTLSGGICGSCNEYSQGPTVDPNIIFGAYFYNTDPVPTVTSNPAYISATPQVTLPPPSGLDNWTTQTITYVTPVSVSKVAIGFFNPTGANASSTRYFSIDDVIITAAPPCTSGTNTTSTAAICEGSTKALTSTTTGGTWSIVSGGGSISGTTYTAPSVASNTTVTVRYTDGCGATSDESFTVTNQQTATNTTSTAAICEGSTKALVSSSGGTWSIVSGGGSISGNTYTAPAVGSNTTVTVRRTLAASGGCPASTADRSFTVTNQQTATNTTSTAAICESSTKALVSSSGGTWSIVTGGGSISGNTYTAPSVGSNTTVTVRRTIAATGGCPASTANRSFTVTNQQTATNTTSTAAICEGSTKTLVSSSGGTWSIVSGGGSISGNTYTAPSVGSNTTVTVRRTIAATGGCPASTANRSFTVTNQPAANNTTSTATICETTTKTLTGTPAGGTFAVVSGGGSISGTTYTAPSVASNTIVTISYTIPASGGCSVSSDNASFTVTNQLIATNTTSTAAICEGSTKTLVSSSGGTWSVVTGGGSISGNTYTAPAVGSNTTVTVRRTIAAAGGCPASTADRSFTVTNQPVANNTTSTAPICETTTKTLTATPAGGTFTIVTGGGSISGTTYTAPSVGANTTVTISYTMAAAGGCPASSDNVSFTVTNQLIATNTTSTAAICEGSTKALVSSSGGTWSVVTGGGSISGNTYTAPNVGSNTTVTVRRTIAAAGGCPASTANRSFTVTNQPVANNTTSTTAICEGLTKTLSATPAGGTFAVVSGGGTISGTTYTAPSVGSNTTVTISYTMAAAGGCPASSDNVSFTVTNASAPANNTTSAAAICEGTTKTLTATPAGGNWTIQSGVGSISGTSYTAPTVASDQSITIRYTIPAVGGCPATFDEVSFTVTNQPVANNTTSTTAICEGLTKALTATPAGGTFAIVSGGGSISGSTYTAPSVGSNTTVTISYTMAAAGGCPASSDNVSFTVTNASAPANNTTSAAAICEGTTKTLTATPAGGNWTIQSGVGSISGTSYTAPTVASDQSITIRYTIPAVGGCPATFDEVSFTVTNQLIANNTTTTSDLCEGLTKNLTATPAGGTWSIVAGSGTITGTTYNTGVVTADETVTVRYTMPAAGGCPATTDDVSFTVNNAPLAANNTTSNADLCEDDTRTVTATPAGGTWSVVSGGGTITGTTYTPANVTVNTTVTTRYTIAASGNCPATTSDVSFTVNNTLLPANNTTATSDLCENDTRALTGTPVGGNWSVIAGGGTISGSTYTPADVNTNTLATVRYTIPDNGACTGSFDEATFNVNFSSAPADNTTATSPMCEGTDRTLTANPAGGTWSITSGGGTISGTTYTAPLVAGATPVTIRYSVPGVGVCPDTFDEVTFTVDDSPGAATNSTTTAPICESNTKALMGTPAGGNWTVIYGGGSITGTTYTPADLTVNTEIIIGYNIPSAGACPASVDSAAFIVYADSNAIINPTSMADICESQTKILTASPSGGTWSIVSGGGSIAGSIYTPANLVSNDTAVTIRYTAAIGNCPSTTDDITFTVNLEEVAINNTNTDNICESATKPLVGSPLGGTWSIVSGGGSITGSTYTPANLTSNDTIVTIRYTIAANGMCPATTDDVTFEVNLEETATNTTSTAPICESSTKPLVVSPSGGIWTILAGGGSISGNIYTPANVIANDTNVTLQYEIPTNGACASSNANVSFVVNLEEIADNQTTFTNICETNTKALVGTPTGGVWSIVSGGGTITGLTYNPPNVVTGDTNVVVSYSFPANGACVATSENASFNVNRYQIAVNTTNNTDICETGTKTLVGSPAGGNWSIVSGGGTITGTTYTPDNITANTNITVRYTIPQNGDCSATTDDVTFTVNKEEIANNLTNTNDLCESDTRILYALPTGGVWSVVSGGGTIVDSLYTPADVTANTPVTVRYTIPANGSCGATTSDVSFNVSLEQIPSNTTPTADICETGTVNLSATPAGGNWSVFNGGGTISGTTYAPANISNNTAVTVSYTIPPNGGCEAYQSDASFNVFADYSPAVNSTSTDTICESETKNLIGSYTGGTWSIIAGGGSITGLEYTPAAIVNDTNVTIRYTIPVNGACPSATDDVTFTVNPDIPYPTNTTTSDPICTTDTKTLVATPAGGMWSVISGPGSITGTTYTPTAVTTPTLITVRYEFLNRNCNNVSDVTFMLNPIAPRPTIAPLANDSTCSGDEVNITANITGTGNSVHWYTNNSATGLPIYIGNNLATYPTSNTTYYAFGVTTQGCQSVLYDSATYYVYLPSIQPTSITANVDTICEGQSANITANGGFLGKNATWRWYLDSCGGSVIGSGDNVTVSPLTTSTYYARAEGDCDTSACTSYTLIVQPAVDATFNLPDSICVNDVNLILPPYIAMGSTQNGTWSGIGVSDTIFDPSIAGLGNHTITYTVGSSPCIDIQTDIITVYTVQPISINPDQITVTATYTDTLNVELNDSSRGFIDLVNQPAFGTASISNNRILYLAPTDFRGRDSLVYEVCDYACNNTCDTAIIILQVDLNVFDNPDDGNVGIWGVTPNNDGINDVLYIDDLYQHPNNKITIYNRWGDQIFNAEPYQNDWSGQKFTWGSYFFILEFKDSNELFKGIIHLQK